MSADRASAFRCMVAELAYYSDAVAAMAAWDFDAFFDSIALADLLGELIIMRFPLWLLPIVLHTSLRACKEHLAPEHAVVLPKAGVIQCFGISIRESACIDGDVMLTNVIMDSVCEQFGDFRYHTHWVIVCVECAAYLSARESRTSCTRTRCCITRGGGRLFCREFNY